ncbi:hypothetical protein H100_01588 [Trichophyton rubrum MR850]|nr:hypothetical protein H100_01588 [Trichophyton rubrum MR850]
MAPTTFGEFLDPVMQWSRRESNCNAENILLSTYEKLRNFERSSFHSSNNDNNDTTTIRHSLMEYSVQLDGTSRVEGSERTVHMAASLPSLFFRISSDQDPRNSRRDEAGPS